MGQWRCSVKRMVFDRISIGGKIMKTSSGCVLYTEGYKFRLAETVWVNTNLRPVKEIRTQNVVLTRDGSLIILSGFAWDGATGAYNNKSIFKAALAHDALYMLLRECKDQMAYRCGIVRGNDVMAASLVDFDMLRRECDKTLIDISNDNGMWEIRQKWVYRAVEKFAFNAAYCQREIKCK